MRCLLHSLKASVWSNMLFINVTMLIFQLPMSWLNDDARLNIPLITHTCEVFHPLMSWLNDDAS